MHTHRRLIVNTALMTGSSIVMRCIALVFQAWLVGHIGAAGIGLYQLVLSVSVLFATFAISGIRFAATRLISEEMGLERGAGVTGAMRRCACYALFFGLCAGTLVYFLAEPVGFLWIGDARTVRSLRITSISLPCIALSAVMDGYFTASGRVWKPTLVHLIEQLVSITCVMWFLSLAAAGDLEQSCAAVTAGGACADAVSLLMMTAMYTLDRRKYRRGGDTVPHLTRRMLAVALPLAVFALWDRALLAAPHIRTDGERFSAAGRANATACTLYTAEHVTKVPLGSNSVWDGGWTAGTMDGSALARARRTLRALHEAGLLCDDSYAAALSVCRLDYGSWELYTASCGLTQLVRRPEEIYTGTDTEHVYIQLILSDDDEPLYFNYQNDLGQGDTLADDAVAQYCALLGLDEFTDWQYPDWGTAVRDFGAAGYSETAQVYAVANASGYSVTLSAASMTPQTFAALNTQYGEETS